MAKAFDPAHIQTVRTKDGSPTLFNPYFDEHYHSIHGARRESEHVFIEAGLKAVSPESGSVRIFELGFGTGLNAWLTLLEAERSRWQVHYISLELYPLPESLWQDLVYGVEETEQQRELFGHLHQAAWEQPVELTDYFLLEKRAVDYLRFEPASSLDLIYFDAFAPEAQPELWSVDAMKRLRSWCNLGAVFVTYSAKGDVRRALQQAGFRVEKLPGPPGKREMLRGTAV